MDVGLLHVVKQAAVLAVARIVFSADADAGEVADLVFRHASHTEMVRDIVPENGLKVVGAKIAKHVETKFPDRTVEVRSLSVTVLHHRSSGLMPMPWARWTDLCLG